MFLCPIVLAFMLAIICGFLALCRALTARIEGAPYYGPTPDVDAWAAELDVAIGVDHMTGDVDAGWSMVPMVDAWRPLAPSQDAPTQARTGRPTLRDMCLV